MAADLPRTSHNRSAHSCAEHMVIMIRLDYSDDYDGAERDDHCPAHSCADHQKSCALLFSTFHFNDVNFEYDINFEEQNDDSTLC